MGACTTLSVSRRAAKQYLLAELASGKIDDEKLSRILDVLLYDSLYNVSIVGVDNAPDDASLGWEQ